MSQHLLISRREEHALVFIHVQGIQAHMCACVDLDTEAKTILQRIYESEISFSSYW